MVSQSNVKTRRHYKMFDVSTGSVKQTLSFLKFQQGCVMTDNIEHVCLFEPLCGQRRNGCSLYGRPNT